MKAISACLCGVNCKYDGKNNVIKGYESKRDEYLMVCPELEVGLGVPRVPVEIQGEILTNAYDDLVSGQIKVVSKKGKDVSKAFIEGAHIVLNRLLENNIKVAILKEGSPSCGVHEIHDGHFTNHKVAGTGVLTALLIKHGIEVISDIDACKEL